MMSDDPILLCDAWEDQGDIPVAFTAPIEPNIQPPSEAQPENRKPVFSFRNAPSGTRMIALVVHDVLDGEPVNGERSGWTHYTALYSPDGTLLDEGKTSEEKKGWVGPYPEQRGEYHCTAYFLSEPLPGGGFSRDTILAKFDTHGLGSANIVGNYRNPQSK